MTASMSRDRATDVTDPAHPGGHPYATWGPAGSPPALSRRARGFLAAALGAGEPTTQARRASLAGAVERVPPTALRPEAVDALASAIGRDHVLLEAASRVLRSGGLSYTDLVRRRAGEAVDSPDAVVRPASHDEVRAVVDACVAHDVALVAVGGGTSVVGGVRPDRGTHHAVVALDLARLDRVGDVDRVSGTVAVGAGVRGPELERVLAAQGYTLGHMPQSFARASIGGYVATRSAGQASSGYGRIADMVTEVKLATPLGDWCLGRAPASAAGPDLLQVVVGSEGTLGVITEVGLRVRRLPEVRRYEAWVVPGFDTGAGVLRDLVQTGAAPDVGRLSDATETTASLALSGPSGIPGVLGRAYVARRGSPEPCLVVLGWEGRAAGVRLRRREARALLRRAGAASLGGRTGESWRRHRFDGPFLRDTLLDEGVCVETLETATSWAALSRVREAVRDALRGSLEGQGTPPLVGCHVSHLYETGASLYFTVLARQRPGQEVAQWAAAKQAACEALVREGATITHHHAVGRDHLPYLTAEVGDVGVEVLRAVKRAVDPAGVLNPGVLIP